MAILGKKIIFSIRRQALLIFVIFLSICQPLVINAIEENLIIKSEAINPGSFYYSFKRLWEKGLERVQFSKQSKINFYQSQLKTRLAELNYVVERRLLSKVQTSSERFAYQAGVLAEEVKVQNKTEEKQNLIKQFGVYSNFLAVLRDNYPANTSFWMLVQHDINSLNILSDQLK